MDGVITQKTYDFALRIVKMYQHLSQEKREFILSKQVLRSGTSIGANVTEAQGAISKRDFSAKISIAYKEALETKYWLKLLLDADYLEEKAFRSVFDDCDEICKILYSILKKTRINNEQ
jgi:four helix bundle protein